MNHKNCHQSAVPHSFIIPSSSTVVGDAINFGTFRPCPPKPYQFWNKADAFNFGTFLKCLILGFRHSEKIDMVSGTGGNVPELIAAPIVRDPVTEELPPLLESSCQYDQSHMQKCCVRE